MRMPTITREQLEARLQAADRPLLVDFYQQRCAPCHAPDRRLERTAPAYPAALAFVRVDLDRDVEVAERFAVASLPTLLILADGREAARLDGRIRPEDLRRAFDAAAVATAASRTGAQHDRPRWHLRLGSRRLCASAIEHARAWPRGGRRAAIARGRRAKRSDR